MFNLYIFNHNSFFLFIISNKNTHKIIDYLMSDFHIACYAQNKQSEKLSKPRINRLIVERLFFRSRLMGGTGV